MLPAHAVQSMVALFTKCPIRIFTIGLPTTFLSLQRHCSTSAIRSKRVLGAIAHINSGKTTTSEAMLYAAGALHRMGNVDAGDTAMDYLPAERERGITINAAAICFDWRKHQIFLVDSPGHLDFTYEVERALKVMDGVIVLLDAVAGVQPQTETVWRQADANQLPRIVFVNKMDRDGADFEKTVESVQRYFLAKPVVVQVPIFDESTHLFCGVYDLLNSFDGDSGDAFTSSDEGGASLLKGLSSQQRKYVDKAVEALVETIAEVNDELMSLWIDAKPIPKHLAVTALRDACISRRLVPVMCGSSLKGIGVELLMDSVIKYLPSPLDRSPVQATTSEGMEINVPASYAAPFLAYAFKVTHDKHRGRMVHLRAFAGGLNRLRVTFLNTTKKKKEIPTKLLRVLADRYIEIESISAGDIFAAVGLKYTETGDTLILQEAPKSSHVVMSSVATPPAVFSVALEVDSTTEERDLQEMLTQLVQEDCSLETKVDEETGESLLSGMGELHLEVAVDRMSRALKFPIRMSKPRVAYRETVIQSTRHTEKYDVTIGSNRLRATLCVEVNPIQSEHSRHENNILISNDAFSAEERLAIKDGIDAALGRGPLLGSPMINVRVSVQPSVNSNAQVRHDTTALRACSSKAVRDAIKLCHPRILEPVMHVECVVPEIVTGDVISEISHPTRCRGTIMEVDAVSRSGNLTEHKMSALTAIVPLEGIIGWATKMRSITKGRGDFTTRFDSYRLVDDVTQQRLISSL